MGFSRFLRYMIVNLMEKNNLMILNFIHSDFNSKFLLQTIVSEGIVKT